MFGSGVVESANLIDVAAEEMVERDGGEDELVPHFPSQRSGSEDVAGTAVFRKGEAFSEGAISDSVDIALSILAEITVVLETVDVAFQSCGTAYRLAIFPDTLRVTGLGGGLHELDIDDPVETDAYTTKGVGWGSTVEDGFDVVTRPQERFQGEAGGRARVAYVVPTQGREVDQVYFFQRLDVHCDKL